MIDFRDARLGEKINDFELSGYPVRIECGERDLQFGKCVVASRISGEKVVIERSELSTTVDKMHTQGQQMLLEASTKRLRENTVACETLEDVGRAIEGGKFALYEWDGNPQMEVEIKERFKATTRCIPFAGQFTDELLVLKNPENVRVVIARNF